ncbi:MAG: tol-pal system-associated acyl-CoA thioesterase [Gammaproteobacteria bacterium]|nr:tol-pal system-associated acyl-CoA thioesterase [Gammaproteobacteria bacterium]
MFYWPVRVYYEDTDSGGVVYYANYLRYLERARTEWLRNLGVEQDVLAKDAGLIFAVRSLTIDYLRPARFNEQLYVGAAVSARRAASLDFAQRVVRADSVPAATAVEGGGDGELCTARVRIVCVDAETLRPRRIPDYLLAETIREG